MLLSHNGRRLIGLKGLVELQLVPGHPTSDGAYPVQLYSKADKTKSLFSFLALSRDVDTGSCHRASDALRRYKSGTGLASGITSAAPGIILVIAALSLIHCQTFGGNDNERMDCGSSAA